LKKAYAVSAPGIGPALGGQISLGQLQERYAGPTLGGFQPEMAPAPVEGGNNMSTVVIGGREVFFDPELGEYVDAATGEPVEGYKRGGQVRGNARTWGEFARDMGRSVGKGVTFGWNDEIEAWLRTLAKTDPEAFNRALQDIRKQQASFERTDPGYAFAGEMAGALGTAFVPGLQGLSAARVAAMGPKARTAYELALATGQGAAYGAGTAYDNPKSKRDPLAVGIEEGAGGLLGYGAGRGVGAAGRAAYQRVPQRAKDKAARSFAAVTNRLPVRGR
jgi:hypothetical protein